MSHDENGNLTERKPCPACGKAIKPSSEGYHFRKHVKDGSMVKREGFELRKAWRRDSRGQRTSYNRLQYVVWYEVVRP